MLLRKLALIVSMACGLFLGLAAPALAQNQTINIQAIANPQAEGKLKVVGKVTCTGLFPKGQKVDRNHVTVRVIFIEPGGTFPAAADWVRIRPYNMMKGKRALTKEELQGKGVAAQKLVFGRDLGKGDEGKTIDFSETVEVPKKAASYLVRATLRHQWSGTWPAIVFRHDELGPKPVVQGVTNVVTDPDKKIIGLESYVENLGPDEMTDQQMINEGRRKIAAALKNKNLSAEKRKKLKWLQAALQRQQVEVDFRREFWKRFKKTAWTYTDKFLGYYPVTSTPWGVITAGGAALTGDFKGAAGRLAGAAPWKGAGTIYSATIDASHIVSNATADGRPSNGSPAPTVAPGPSGLPVYGGGRVQGSYQPITPQQ